MAELLIGKISHYYSGAQVAAIELTGDLAVGDTIRVVGHTSNFTQRVGSMEIEHGPVEQAGKGDHVGVRVETKARQHDLVYRVV